MLSDQRDRITLLGTVIREMYVKLEQGELAEGFEIFAAAQAQDTKSVSLKTMVDMILGKYGEEGDDMGDSIRRAGDGGNVEENDMLTEKEERSYKGVSSSGIKEDVEEECTVCHSIGFVFRCIKCSC